METLSSSEKDLVRDFISITECNSESDGADATEKVIKMMALNDWDLNSAVSNYFDTKFTTVDEPSIPSASGFEALDTASFGMLNRGTEQRERVINLQDQLFSERYDIRLPRAPKIQNKWQFELGIYCSLKDKEKERQNPRKDLKPQTHNILWIILLIIPKALLNLVMAIIKCFTKLYFATSKSSDSLIFPSNFNYDKYDPGYSIDKHFENAEAKNVEDLKSSALDSSILSDNSTVTNTIESSTTKNDETNSVTRKYNISEKNFNELHINAQSNYCWLLVILVNDDPHCVRFVKNMLLSKEFEALFSKVDGLHKDAQLYIANSEKTPEAFEVGKTYRARKVPYVSLIGNVSNNSSIMPSMSVTYKSNVPLQLLSKERCPATAQKVLKDLNKVLEKYSPQLLTQKIDKQEIEFSRLLKQQQDDAYTQSLEKDRLKKIQKENEKKEKEEIEILAKMRQNFLFHLIKSDWFTKINENPTSTIKISIKLPHGKRLISTVSGSLLLYELYLFIEIHLFMYSLISEPDSSFEDENDVLQYAASQKPATIDISPLEYYEKFQFDFDLIQPFPKKVIEVSSCALNEVKEIKSGGNFLIELKDNDESSEEED